MGYQIYRNNYNHEDKNNVHRITFINYVNNTNATVNNTIIVNESKCMALSSS
jgi:hypothetical protein